MSSDIALRFSGLLKVMTPTPSVTPCRILPSAKDLSVALGIFSIGGAFSNWSLIHVDWFEALLGCLGNGGRLPFPLAGRRLWGRAANIQSLFLVIARSEATKQSSFLLSQKKLDCFASPAMTDQTALRLQEGADIRPRERRSRLYFSPPFGDAGMFLCGYLIGCNFLVDPLHEGDRRDIRDRIGLADQPAGGI